MYTPPKNGIITIKIIIITDRYFSPRLIKSDISFFFFFFVIISLNRNDVSDITCARY